MSLQTPPLALYVHIPWCEKKCPYCDFNSHVSAAIPEATYVAKLCQELDHYRNNLGHDKPRPLVSIFFGGGTPSLFSPAAIEQIIHHADNTLGLAEACEITLEANPGSSEQRKFQAFLQAGVNRLSIGIQSFNDEHLKRLGRIHSSDNAKAAIDAAYAAGFSNINIDLMYGLGEQTVQQAMHDLQTATSFATPHVSWYQLTIEQNTEYFKRPPVTPTDVITDEIEQQGQQWLQEYGLARYEVSAYAKQTQASQHNLNYWQFGDYLGIGAGAHSKLTQANGAIVRQANTRLPKDYLARADSPVSQQHRLTVQDLAGEFMMNALRLRNGVEQQLLSERTGLRLSHVKATAEELVRHNLMRPLDSGRLQCTTRGYALLNSVVEQFL